MLQLLEKYSVFTLIRSRPLKIKPQWLAYLPYGLLIVLGSFLFNLSGEEYKIDWVSNEIFQLSFAIKIEPLSTLMLLFVLFIGINIYQYSGRYLLSDPSQSRFQYQLLLTLLSVGLFILSSNLLTAFIGWQMIGVNLYLLLNHYHYHSNANRSAKKKFIINRLGDMCFFTAVILCTIYYQETSFSILNEGTQHNLNLIILTLIFISVMTKSAQFPFHTWLPDTMEAPTPVSALMHAGIINAGGLLLAKLSPSLIQHPPLMLFILSIGSITFLMGTLFKLVQMDTKRQLAYSTMSQMGYMIMQIGLGCFTTAVFHLITHGLYKATLFLDSGSTLVSKISRKNETKKNYLLIFHSLVISTIVVVSSIQITKIFGKEADGVLLLDLFMFIAVNEYMLSILKKKEKQITLFPSILFIFIACTAYYFFLNMLYETIFFTHQKNLNHPAFENLIGLIITAWYSASLFLNKNNTLFKTNFFKKLIVLIHNKFYIELYFQRLIIAPFKKTNGRRNIIIYLFLSQVLMNTLILFYDKENKIIIYSLITTLLFLILFQINKPDKEFFFSTKKELKNKLSPKETYLSITLFMLIGLPFTPSFFTWFYIVKMSILYAPKTLPIILMSNILISIIVLHILQDYIFTSKYNLREKYLSSLPKYLFGILHRDNPKKTNTHYKEKISFFLIIMSLLLSFFPYFFFY